ncbi:MAG: hypothetical protein JXJ22_12545 [Bacteroidales bacterium]|nr:hypothetical protein [Bacteroidales bacterium]
MNKIAFLILSIIFGSFSNENKTINFENYKNSTGLAGCDYSQEISFYNYKLFMFYTRDSIIRELLSTQLDDYCNSCKTLNKDKPVTLNWNIKINFNHTEIAKILTNLEDYGSYYNFLYKENNEFIVDTDYLNYRESREYENDINIFPDLNKLETQMQQKIHIKFGIDNTWNESLNENIINQILSPKQIDAYQNWKNKIGIKRTKKITRKKILR